MRLPRITPGIMKSIRWWLWGMTFSCAATMIVTGLALYLMGNTETAVVLFAVVLMFLLFRVMGHTMPE